MTERLQAFAVGLGGALAVSLPAVLVAQILDAALDGDLPVALTLPLSLVAVAGAVVGGVAVGQRRRGGTLTVAALAGLVALGLVAGLGTVRRGAAGDDAPAVLVPVAMVVGAGLGLAGGALGARRAGRTRP